MTKNDNRNILVVVKTPMQLINALEYLHKFKIDACHVDLFIVNDHDKYRKLILKIAKKHKWRKIFNHIVFNNFSRLNRIFSAILTRFLVSFKFKGTYNTIIVGHYSQAVQRFFLRKKCDERVLVDDGIQTLAIGKLRYDEIEDGRVDTNDPTRINRIINWIWGFQKNINKPLKVFTSFNIEPYKIDEVVSNDFEYMKYQFQSLKEDDSILFIGSDIVELGGLDEDIYISSIKKIITNYPTTDKIYYCPKKTEELQKVKKIGDLLEIVRIDYPIELLPVLKGIKPKVFASLYSSAVFNFANMFGSSAEYAIVDIRKWLKKESKFDFVVKAYDYQEKMTTTEIKILNI